MFTGIITAIGQVEQVEILGTSAEFGHKYWFSSPAEYLTDVQLGDSIAINGACMTVIELDLAQRQFAIVMSAQSLAKTTPLALGTRVNLEKAMRANARLDGHIVSGHVDCLGKIAGLTPIGESLTLAVSCPLTLQAFFVYKGSVTINGVSLTINNVIDSAEAVIIEINLIPHTIKHTNLQYLTLGDAVNVEVDMLARYVQRMLALVQLPTK